MDARAVALREGFDFAFDDLPVSAEPSVDFLTVADRFRDLPEAVDLVAVLLAELAADLVSCETRWADTPRTAAISAPARPALRSFAAVDRDRAATCC
jgi:hypothetical protein